MIDFLSIGFNRFRNFSYPNQYPVKSRNEIIEVDDFHLDCIRKGIEGKNWFTEC